MLWLCKMLEIQLPYYSYSPPTKKDVCNDAEDGNKSDDENMTNDSS